MRRLIKSHLPQLGRKKEPRATTVTSLTPPASHQTATASSPSNNTVNTPAGDSEPRRPADPPLQSSGKATIPIVPPAAELVPQLTPGSGDAAQDGLAQLLEGHDDDETGDPDGEKNGKLSPISELWDEAYDELCACEEKKNLMRDYQEQLSKFIPEHRDAVILTQKCQRREQMVVFIDQRTEELKESKWKGSVAGHSFELADLVQKVLGIIDCKFCLLKH
jgi:hypothetical protein